VRPDKEIDAAGLALLAAARTAAGRSQAEAHERCGAAAETADGAVHPGATYAEAGCTALAACAERVAVWSARAASAAPIARIALWMPSSAGAHPCGSCLQVLLELAPGAEFLAQRGDDPPQRLGLERLMPDAFLAFQEPAPTPEHSEDEDQP